MSFLNRSVLQERAAAAMVEKHPLLKECDVPTNVKQAYLQGCVLAVLERDDGKVTDAARQELLRLGKSLEMLDAEIIECITVVSELESAEDQSDFLAELSNAIGCRTYSRFFIKDFERMLGQGGALTGENQKTLELIRTMLKVVECESSDERSPGKKKGKRGEVNRSLVAGGELKGRVETIKVRVNNCEKTLHECGVVWPEGDKVVIRTADKKLIRAIWGVLHGRADVLASLALNEIIVRDGRKGGKKLYNPVLDLRSCKGCDKCCWYDCNQHAIIKKDEHVVAVDPVKCNGCGKCLSTFSTCRGVERIDEVYDERHGDIGQNETQDVGRCSHSYSQDSRPKSVVVRNVDVAELRRQAYAYLNGDGVKQHEGNALQKFLEAAKRGDAESQNMVGMCYLYGYGTSGVSERTALKWCLQAANQGLPIAQYNVGSFYQNGQGCAVDNVMAVKWFRAAADQGLADAQNALGICYCNGAGVAQDFNEAVAWCKKAASQEHPYAAWNMATFYMNGQGVPQDAEQAKWWVQKAAALGNEDAKKCLREWNAQLEQSVTYSHEPPSDRVGEFWHDNSDTITNGLKIAGNLLLRGLFGG